jgi:hypothetical protein
VSIVPDMTCLPPAGRDPSPPPDWPAVLYLLGQLLLIAAPALGAGLVAGLVTGSGVLGWATGGSVFAVEILLASRAQETVMVVYRFLRRR